MTFVSKHDATMYLLASGCNILQDVIYPPQRATDYILWNAKKENWDGINFLLQNGPYSFERFM